MSNTMTPTALSEYDRWNQAIVQYVTAGVPKGSPVYLCIDERDLLVIRRQYLGSPTSELPEAVDAFEKAARSECVKCESGEERQVDLSRMHGPASGPPRCVAFLAAMVLAAHRMQDDKKRGISVGAYFQRLRQALDLDDETGRPAGLVIPQGYEAPEQPLWNRWNRWIEASGWRVTARKGEGPHTYTNYPISQSSLRQGDRDRLVSLFQTHAMPRPRFSDQEQFGHWLRRFASTLRESPRVQRLITESTGSRLDLIVRSAFEVFQTDWSREAIEHGSSSQRPAIRSVVAGLYRTENFCGEPTYLPYPKIPHGWDHARWRVQNEGESAQLTLHRAGWFCPLPWKVLDLGARCDWPVAESEGPAVVLPARDFFILIRDPEEAEPTVLATWGRPLVGEPFLLVVHSRFQQALDSLSREKYLCWEDVQPVGSWYEYHGCQILRADWPERVHSSLKEFVDALRPAANHVGLSLSGGLAAPGRSLWVHGHPPLFTVHGGGSSIKWTLAHETSLDKPTHRGAAEPFKPTPLPANLCLGTWLLTATVSSGEATRRQFRIVDWDALIPAANEEFYSTSLPGGSLCGARLTVSDS